MPKMKDKRITLNQAMTQVNEAYDHLEVIAVATAERALREQFGFGDVRLERFKAAYLELFGEEAAKYAEETRKKMRRRF
jgi:proline dehydrogenase